MTAQPQATLAGARVLAQFNSYAGLVDALRARARELRVSPGSEAFAEVSGLPSRYASKLVSPAMPKKLGATSLQPMLACLGVQLALLEDEEALERVVSRLPRMDETHVRTRSKSFTLSGTFLKKRARLGRLAKAAVHRDKQARRAKWRLAKARQRQETKMKVAVDE
jgi:hypothetical protein